MFTRRLFAVAAALTVMTASLGADVKIVTTMSMEGNAPGMAGQQMPTMTQWIKGTKSRADMEAGAVRTSSITDAANRRVYIINHADKSVQVFDGTPVPADKTLPAPKMEISLKNTGRTRTVQGVECTESTFSITLSMSEMMGNAQVPPEAAAMLQGVRMRMDGSIWAATTGPGAAEYIAFSKAQAAANMQAVLAGAMPTMSGGLDQVMTAMQEAQGIPYLTEMTMTIEGTGQVVEMMRQMGPMKMRMEVKSVETDPVPDSLFEIPAGYSTVK